MHKVPAFLRRISVVVITGASSGIGESLLKSIAHYRPEISFFNLSRSSPEINLKGLCHIPCDLSDKNQLKTAADQILAALPSCQQGGILLINNSGYGLYGMAADMAHDPLLGMIDLNARAMVDLTSRLLPAIRARGGSIINVASVAAYVPTPTIAVYGATKSFVLSWGLSLRAELRREKINVLTVCPGPTATKFFKRAGFKESPLPPVIGKTSDYVAQKTLAAAARNRAVVTPGLSNKLLRLTAALFPLEIGVPVSFAVLRRVRMKALGK